MAGCIFVRRGEDRNGRSARGVRQGRAELAPVTSAATREAWVLAPPVLYLVRAVTGLACLPLPRVGERPGGGARADESARTRPSPRRHSPRRALHGRRAPPLRDVSFHVRYGEFFSLLGPPGSGKTAVLRAVAGFARADRRSGGGRWTGHRRFATAGALGWATCSRRARSGPTSRCEDHVAFGLEHSKGVGRGGAAPDDVDPAGSASADLTDRRPPSSPRSIGAGSPWRARWRGSRACCCSTNRWHTWSRPCARGCVSSSPGCIAISR